MNLSCSFLRIVGKFHNFKGLGEHGTFYATVEEKKTFGGSGSFTTEFLKRKL